MTPLISILMPAHNAARFIGQALDSIRAQTYPRWELIVIDDASTDETPAIVQAYKERLCAEAQRDQPHQADAREGDSADRRIRIIRVERIGHPAGVRNVGLPLAQGEYIAFLDADDRYFPDALEKLSRPLRQDPELIAVYGFARTMDANGDPLPDGIVLTPNANPQPGEAPYAPNPDYWHSWENIVTSRISCLLSALMIRRDVLERVGGFNESLRGAEDYEFYVRLFLHDYDHVACLADYVYGYRIHADSLTKAPRDCDRILADCLRILDWLFTEAPLPGSCARV